MPQINEAAVGRLNSAQLSGEKFLALFRMLAQHPACQETGGVVSFHLGYQQPEDEIKPGDLFPSITLSLHPPAEITDGTPQPNTASDGSGSGTTPK